MLAHSAWLALALIVGPYLPGDEPGLDRPILKKGCVEVAPSWHVSTEAWFKSKAFPDGSWRFDDRHQTLDAGTDDSRIRATAISGLALMSLGHTPKHGRHKALVRQASRSLVEQLQLDDASRIALGTDDCLAVASASLFFSELHLITGETAPRSYAESLHDWLWSQQNDDGGFARRKGETSQLRKTVWVLVALRSAEKCKCAAPPTAWDRLKGFVSSSERTAEEGGADEIYLLYAQQLLDGLPRPLNEQMLARLLEVPRDNVEAVFFRQQLLVGCRKDEARLMRAMQETSFMLRDAQATTSAEPGSWFFATDSTAKNEGRLYHTSLATLSLTTFYRGLPLVDEVLEKPPEK